MRQFPRPAFDWRHLPIYRMNHENLVFSRRSGGQLEFLHCISRVSKGSELTALQRLGQAEVIAPVKVDVLMHRSGERRSMSPSRSTLPAARSWSRARSMYRVFQSAIVLTTRPRAPS